MACEIVKAWVGHMDNTYYYCRDHKIECQSAGICGMPPKIDPKFVVDDAFPPSGILGIRPYDQYTLLKSIPVGRWILGLNYSIVGIKPSQNEICILDENAMSVYFTFQELNLYFTRSKPLGIQHVTAQHSALTPPTAINAQCCVGAHINVVVGLNGPMGICSNCGKIV